MICFMGSSVGSFFSFSFCTIVVYVLFLWLFSPLIYLPHSAGIVNVLVDILLLLLPLLMDTFGLLTGMIFLNEAREERDYCKNR